MAQNKTEIVKCISSSSDAITAMKNTSLETIKSLLHRMGMEYEEGLPKEAYLIAWQEEFCSERHWILKIFPGKYLDLLMEIWDNDEIEMDDFRWEMLQYLKSFGLLYYKRGYEKLGEEGQISYVESLKQHFYFLLKGKDSKKYKDQYDRWDNAFCGMTYYYGMIPLQEMHGLFCEALKEDVSYDEFVSFIKCRADIWSLGAFLQDGNGVEYFQNHNVEEPEITYVYLQEHKDLDYRRIPYDDLLYVKKGYGIDNRWAGISDLGNYLVEDLGISYYRATVLVHTMLLAIQNSKAYDNIKGKFDMISFKDDQDQRLAEQYLRELYDHTPIYEYKGHTRAEYTEYIRKKEWKKRRNRFTMISGGKQ